MKKEYGMHESPNVWHPTGPNVSQRAHSTLIPELEINLSDNLR